MNGFEVVSRFPGGGNTIPASQQPHEVQTAPAGRTRVLIVEDGMIIAEDLRRRCEASGYMVSGIEASGESAIDNVACSRPDIVLMDIRLSGRMDGIEAAQVIRERFDIPVVYATAYSDDATLDRARRTFPFGYLSKPVNSRDLRTTIELALHHHRAESRLRDEVVCQRLLLEANPDPVMLVRSSGDVVAFNSAAAKLVGLSEDPGTSLFGFASPQDHLAIRNALQRACDANTYAEADFTLVSGQGSSSRIRFTARRAAGFNGTSLLILTLRSLSASNLRDKRRTSLSA